MAGIMDMFRSVMPQAQAVQPAQQPLTAAQIANPTQVAQPTQPLPGVDPANPTVPLGSAAPQDQSPLDAFAKLWEPAIVDPNAVNPNFFATLDPNKVMESARKVNFSNQEITPEIAAAIAAGGEQAIKAVQSLINHSSQSVYGQSAIATSKIVEKALAAQREQFQKQLPGILKSQLVSDSLATENPIFNNPALAPMVEMARTQVLQKFPNATQAEIKEQVVSFFNAMQGALAPKPIKTEAEKNADMDWGAFLGQ